MGLQRNKERENDGIRSHNTPPYWANPVALRTFSEDADSDHNKDQTHLLRQLPAAQDLSGQDAASGSWFTAGSLAIIRGDRPRSLPVGCYNGLRSTADLKPPCPPVSPRHVQALAGKLK